jgi:hypothetical protein
VKKGAREEDMGPFFSGCNFFLLFSLLRKGFHL